MVRTNNANRIIDTDILIDASKQNENAITFLTMQQDVGIQISIISAIELVVGCRNKTELSQTQKFLEGCAILPITVTASEIAYQLIETLLSVAGFSWEMRLSQQQFWNAEQPFTRKTLATSK